MSNNHHHLKLFIRRSYKHTFSFLHKFFLDINKRQKQPPVHRRRKAYCINKAMFNYIQMRFYRKRKQTVFIRNVYIHIFLSIFQCYRSLVRFVVDVFDVEHISRNVFP